MIFDLFKKGKNEANLDAFLPGDDNKDNDDDGVDVDNNDENHEYVDTKICISWNMKIFNRSIKFVFNYLYLLNISMKELHFMLSGCVS